MKIGIIVQTRMGSTRLPGKVLMKADESNLMLDYSINQLKNCKHADEIIIATSNLERDTPIEVHCTKSNIPFYRGDEEDVLSRFYDLATNTKAQVIIRITADCPFVDKSIISKAIKLFQENNIDYLSNVLNRTYPDGLDVEIFSYKALKR